MSLAEASKTTAEIRMRLRLAIAALFDLDELFVVVEGRLGPEIFACLPERHGPRADAAVPAPGVFVAEDDRHGAALFPIGLELGIAVVGFPADEDDGADDDPPGGPSPRAVPMIAKAPA